MKKSMMVAGLAWVLLLTACRQGAGGPGPPASLEPWSLETADLLFTSNRDGNEEIYLLPAGQEEWVNLTNDPARDNWGVWSPDGTRIAFQSRRSGNLDVWVMNADGSNAVQLTDALEHDYLPEWTPDGESITFTSWRQQPGEQTKANHVFIMKADGTDQRRLMAESPGTSAGASWSPDGARFAITRNVRGKGADIFLADATGAVTGRLTESEAFSGSPAFAPEGTRIAFYEERDDASDIVVMNPDGSHRRTLVSGGEVSPGKSWYPRWSPDGRWIVYTATVPGSEDEDLNILAVPADGSAEPIVLVSGPGREAEGRWRPRG